MAFEDFVRTLRDLDDVAVINAGYAHPYKCHDREPNFCRVDLGTIACDDRRVLEFANALDHGRSREADATAELSVAGTCI